MLASLVRHLDPLRISFLLKPCTQVEYLCLWSTFCIRVENSCMLHFVTILTGVVDKQAWNGSFAALLALA